jgi:hypothetical protein
LIFYRAVSVQSESGAERIKALNGHVSSIKPVNGAGGKGSTIRNNKPKNGAK